MRKLIKVVALIVTVGLLSQPMAFAQADSFVSLVDVQRQARQDASFLNDHYGLLTVAGVTSVGAMFFTLYATAMNERTRRAEQKLAKSLEENESLKAQNKALRTQNKTLKGGHHVSKQRTQTVKTELKNTQVASKELKEAYEKEIAELNAKLAKMQHQFNVRPANIMLKTGSKEFDMQAYRPLLERSTNPEAREALLKQIKTEPWYKSLSAEEKKFFDTELHYLMEVFRHKGIEKEIESTAVYTFEQTLVTPKAVRPGLKPLHQLLHEIAYKGAAKPMAFALVLFTGLDVAHAAKSSNMKSMLMAARIDTDFNSFLSASSQQLEKIQDDKLVRETIMRNAAALYNMAHLHYLSEDTKEKDMMHIEDLQVMCQNLKNAGATRPTVPQKKVAR